MPTDVGIKLVADGEAQFKSALDGVNAQIKNLNSEMKPVVDGLADMSDGEDTASAKTDILKRSLDAAKQKVEILTSQYEKQKKKLDELADELANAAKEHGENSKEAKKAADEYNKQAKYVNNLGTKLNTAAGYAKKFARELENTGDAADEAADNMEDAGDKGSVLADVFKGTFSANLLSGFLDGLKNIFTVISDLVSETEEYRKIMGTLDTSSQNAGYTAEQTKEAYMQLYGVLGDNQAAATTTANLQALNLEQDKLMELIDGTIGAWATYGDSIPIDGLAESINETVKVGQVTGTLADVLNWAGTSEDDFNAKLAACNTEQERAQVILDELAKQGLPAVSEQWRETNGSIVEANEAQAEMDEAMGRIAEVFAPAVNDLNQFLADTVGHLADMLENGSPLIPMFVGLGVAIAGLALITFISQIGGVVGILGKLHAGILAVNAAMAANPILLVVTIIAALVAALITAYQTNDEFRAKVQAAWEKVKEVISNTVGKLVEFFTKDIPEGVKKAIEFLKDLPENALKIGEDLIKGLWNGIKNMGAWVAEKIKGFCGDVLGGIKEFFGIESPSKVMRDEVGVMLGKGVAQGIQKSENDVMKAAQDLNDKLLAKEEDLAEKLKDNKLDEATRENLTKQYETIKQFRSEYESALNELESAQSSMAEKLAGYGELFTIAQTETGDIMNLTDLQAQINAINEYGDALEKLKSRGIDDSLMDEIQGLDIDTATEYMDKLLSMTDSEYDEYMRLWAEKQEASQKVASEFYKTKFADLKNGMTMQMIGYYGEFTTVGNNLMAGVAEGVEEGRSGVVEAVKDALQDAVDAANDVMDINSPSKVFARIGRYMAEGVGVGFNKQMVSVSNDIAGRMLSTANRVTNETLQNVAAATVTGMQLNNMPANNQPIIVQLVTDGQTLAQVVFDPLKSVAKQRGVVLG